MTKKKIAITAVASVIGISLVAVAAAALVLSKRLDDVFKDIDY